MAVAENMVEAKVSHRFPASPQQVFDVWVNPDLVGGWMSQPSAVLGRMNVKRVEIDPRIGGRFTFSDLRPDGEAVHWGFYRQID